MMAQSLLDALKSHFPAEYSAFPIGTVAARMLSVEPEDCGLNLTDTKVASIWCSFTQNLMLSTRDVAALDAFHGFVQSALTSAAQDCAKRVWLSLLQSDWADIDLVKVALLPPEYDSLAVTWIPPNFCQNLDHFCRGIVYLVQSCPTLGGAKRPCAYATLPQSRRNPAVGAVASGGSQSI
jgi:hypothetical protein